MSNYPEHNNQALYFAESGLLDYEAWRLYLVGVAETILTQIGTEHEDQTQYATARWTADDLRHRYQLIRQKTPATTYYWLQVHESETEDQESVYAFATEIDTSIRAVGKDGDE